MRPFAFLTAIVLALASFSPVHAQTPHLVVSAGTAGQASSLTITSDSPATWKCFTLSGGSAGSYNVVWAESNGTTGGIYFGTIATSSSGQGTLPGPGPTPPPSNDLPIGTLTTAVAASVATVDPAAATSMANAYETLGKAIDAGTIVSPLQLQLVTSAQLLTFTSDQLATFKGFIAAVNGWMDGCQCSGKLTPDRMDQYAKAYHAIAATLKTTPAAPSSTKPGTSKPAAAVDTSPCANGHCPVPTSPGWFRRR